MIFFSTILGSPVRDSLEELIGEVTDVYIKVAPDREFPLIEGIIIKNRHTKKEEFISSVFIESLGAEIELSKKHSETKVPLPVGENIISLKESVLDKQIVDLAGMRVVRVNDLEFGRVGQLMCLIAIDISTRGLLRRLGLRGGPISNLFKPNFLEWKDIRLMDNKIRLATDAQELVRLHPADIANIVEKMNVKQGSIFLQALDPTVAARVLEEIQPDIKKILVKSLGTERTAALMGKMSVDELVDLIQLLPGRESRELINKLPMDSKIQKVKKILEYDEDTAGGLMTTEYVSTHPENTIEQVIDNIKKISHLHHSIQFIYVTDETGRFLGVISMRNLVVADKTRKVKDVMRKPNRKLPIITVDQNVESIAVIMTKYNLLSVAILDKEKKLLGVVTVDDIMRHLVPKA